MGGAGNKILKVLDGTCDAYVMIGKGEGVAARILQALPDLVSFRD